MNATAIRRDLGRGPRDRVKGQQRRSWKRSDSPGGPDTQSIRMSVQDVQDTQDGLVWVRENLVAWSWAAGAIATDRAPRIRGRVSHDQLAVPIARLRRTLVEAVEWTETEEESAPGTAKSGGWAEASGELDADLGCETAGPEAVVHVSLTTTTQDYRRMAVAAQMNSDDMSLGSETIRSQRKVGWQVRVPSPRETDRSGNAGLAVVTAGTETALEAGAADVSEARLGAEGASTAAADGAAAAAGLV
ncbi:uncharacterized protein BJ171DRAFT_510326 [Polychytrium aggregatum]|uniref:uncharacterized protein n=1 Tax=Polychytrium aggregatum TaxID=110093 RepID=UPI0022FF2209|nr:uncharacterized protein BJ171DRAFT_510326 [Polychytrium aggregatum]KAI9203314.1 hypothetical protein BJ171DRAFT_510326 [Polychytrium aggregatum]